MIRSSGMLVLALAGCLTLTSCAPAQEAQTGAVTSSAAHSSAAPLQAEDSGPDADPVMDLISPSPPPNPPTAESEDAVHEYDGQAPGFLPAPIDVDPYDVYAHIQEILGRSYPDDDEDDPWTRDLNLYLGDLGIQQPNFTLFQGYDLLEGKDSSGNTRCALVYEVFYGDGLLFENKEGVWQLTGAVLLPSGCYGIEAELLHFTLNGRERFWLDVLYDTNCGSSPEYTRVFFDLSDWQPVFSFVASQHEWGAGPTVSMFCQHSFVSSPSFLALALDYSYWEEAYLPEHGGTHGQDEDEIDPENQVGFRAKRHVTFVYDDEEGRFLLEEKHSDLPAPCMWMYTEDSTYQPFDNPMDRPLCGETFCRSWKP